MTNKLYLQDAYMQEFKAVVIDSRQIADNCEVILDQTAFYPEGGGQPSDTGTLNGLAVTAVRQEGDRIVHVMQAAPTTRIVTGRIDWSRRFYHMQQHSGQHILSAIFADKWDADTIGFHLGADSTQIDLAINELKPEQALVVEAAANAALYANLPITAEWIAQKDLVHYQLRKSPAKEFANIRLVSAGAIDCCPCGGTHVRATGEIGLIKILGWEKKNHAVRVDFVCGERALSDYQLKHHLAQSMANKLSAPVKDLAEIFTQRLAKADSLAKELSEVRFELSQLQAAAMLHAAPLFKDVRLVSQSLQDALPSDAAQLAKNLTSDINPVVALVAAVNPDAAKAHLVFATNTDRLDMGKLLKTALTKLNGKGGGSPRLAQGGTNTLDKLPEVLNEALVEAQGFLEN